MKPMDSAARKSPPDRVPLSTEQLKEIHNETTRSFLQLVIPFTLVAGFVLGLLTPLIIPFSWTGMAWRYARVGVGLGLFALLGFALFQIVRPRYEHYFRRVVRKRGHEMCLRCGYWLKGLGEDVKQCPECGWRREAAS